MTVHKDAIKMDQCDAPREASEHSSGLPITETNTKLHNCTTQNRLHVKLKKGKSKIILLLTSLVSKQKNFVAVFRKLDQTL